MTSLNDLYRSSLGLLTDLYQLTMAYGYWKSGRRDTQAVFNLFFRRSPFSGGYTVACGLGRVIDFVEHFHFAPEDLAYLATLEGSDGEPLFDAEFLDDLGKMRLECDIDAVPEGTVVFPQEPLVRVKGSLIQCQVLETPLLNLINFETLIATKAARIVQAARGEPVLEFGLRRAQGIDGGLTASRAAYVGGVASTSNLLAGRLYGIPVGGTHAHSWVMSFDDEPEAFAAYADAMPNNCVFLVDTYDTLQGVRNAVEAGKRLRERGHEMLGIRLDSGDLAYLSIEARKILDEGGFPGARIVASNDLDEYIIATLKQQGAKIGLWGVGTRLATGGDQAALGGVYKLSAIRERGGEWRYKIKLSEQAIKVSTPGILQVRRYLEDGEFVADAIYDEESGMPETSTMIDPLDPMRRKQLPAAPSWSDLLEPIFRGGKAVCEASTPAQARQRCRSQLGQLHSGVKRFVNPHVYPVGLEAGVFELKRRLMLEVRGRPV